MPDVIPDGVFLVGILAVLAFGSLVLSAPLGAGAIWRYGRSRRGMHAKALLVSVFNGCGQGLAAGALGFAFVASIGDESAGRAIVPVVGGALVGASALAFVVSYLLVLVGCLLVDRLSPNAERGR